MFFAHGKGERFQFLAPAATYLQNYKQFSISTAAPLVALLAGSTFVVACDAAERVYIWGTLSDTKDAYPKCCKIWDHISLVAAASHFVVAWSDMYAQLKIFGETTITCNKISWDSVSHLACGHDFVVVVSHDVIYSAGANRYGQLGDATDKFYSKTFSKACAALTNITSVACGAYHALCVANGNLYAWGRGERGSLGNGYTYDLNVPCIVLLPGGAIPMRVFAGSQSNRSIVVTKDDRVFLFGPVGNLEEQQPFSLVPVELKKLYQMGVQHACFGYGFCLLQTRMGKLFRIGKYGNNQEQILRLDDHFLNTRVQLSCATTFGEILYTTDANSVAPIEIRLFMLIQERIFTDTIVQCS